jgi:hypothetical protein
LENSVEQFKHKLGEVETTRMPAHRVLPPPSVPVEHPPTTPPGGPLQAKPIPDIPPPPPVPSPAAQPSPVAPPPGTTPPDQTASASPPRPADQPAAKPKPAPQPVNLPADDDIFLAIREWILSIWRSIFS